MFRWVYRCTFLPGLEATGLHHTCFLTLGMRGDGLLYMLSILIRLDSLLCNLECNTEHEQGQIRVVKKETHIGFISSFSLEVAIGAL